MKIVQLLPELDEGGVERGTVELSRELVKQGIGSTVISAGGKLVEQIKKDGGEHIQFDVCSKNILTAPLRIAQLRKILSGLQPDVLHARSRVPAWLTYYANKKLHLPFVTTGHGFNSVNAYSKVMTYGDHVICVSGAIKNYIQDHYQVADHKITVIPRGIDLDLFNPGAVDHDFVKHFRHDFGLKDKYVVTSVGRITQLKDFETFIRAIALVKEKIPNICGLIVGGVRQDKRDYFEKLKTLVHELGVADCIKFTGSQSKIAEIYFLSDIVTLCSKKPESFGRSAAEALAMNVPVLATNHGGVLDIVTNGQNGGLFEIGNYQQLSEGIVSTKMISFVNLNLKIVKEFSLAQMVEKTLQTYRLVA